MEPTDKSISPESMTKVIPIAMIRFMEICRVIFKRFLDVKKYSEDIEKTIIKEIRIKTSPNSLFKRLPNFIKLLFKIFF
jgi:hypothetical protein